MLTNRVLLVTDQRLGFVLEAAGLDGAVHATLLGRVLFPPPATASGVGAWLHWPRAWRAANRLVALIIQRVVGHVVRPNVVPDLFVGPIRERAQLHQATVVIIQLDLADVRARRPLITPQSSHPGVET